MRDMQDKYIFLVTKSVYGSKKIQYMRIINDLIATYLGSRKIIYLATAQPIYMIKG